MQWHHENPSYGGQSGVNPVLVGAGRQWAVADQLPPWPTSDREWLACTGLTLTLWPAARTGPGPASQHPAYRAAQRARRVATQA